MHCFCMVVVGLSAHWHFSLDELLINFMTQVKNFFKIHIEMSGYWNLNPDLNAKFGQMFSVSLFGGNFILKSNTIIPTCNHDRKHNKLKENSKKAKKLWVHVWIR